MAILYFVAKIKLLKNSVEERRKACSSDSQVNSKTLRNSFLPFHGALAAICDASLAFQYFFDIPSPFGCFGSLPRFTSSQFSPLSTRLPRLTLADSKCFFPTSASSLLHNCGMRGRRRVAKTSWAFRCFLDDCISYHI